MKDITIFLLIPIIIFLASCEDSKECNECFSPPTPFTFELVDDQGVNIFTNEVYNIDQLQIIETTTNEKYEFQFIPENDLNLIEISSIGWSSEQVNLSFRFDETEVFSLHVDAARVTEDCCSFTRYNEISIEGANYELENQTGIYQVVIQ